MPISLYAEPLHTVLQLAGLPFACKAFKACRVGKTSWASWRAWRVPLVARLTAIHSDEPVQRRFPLAHPTML